MTGRMGNGEIPRKTVIYEPGVSLRRIFIGSQTIIFLAEASQNTMFPDTLR